LNRIVVDFDSVKRIGRNELKKNALVLFTKYPEPGLTKTRLMQEHGGALTGEEAAALYRAMLLDVAVVGFCALEHCRQEKVFGGGYDLFVSSSPATNMPKVQELFRSEFLSADIHYIVDQGRNFDEHFNDCYRQLFDLGYHAVVCIGGDLPLIRPDIINRGFQWLSQLEKKSGGGAMVLAPCQEGGVSLVGITKETKIDFGGVFYNPDGITALDAMVNIAIHNQIPTALLETLSDVDNIEDLGHTITVINAMVYAAQFQPDVIIPRRTIAFIREVGLFATTQPSESLDPRSKIDG
jgi:glycosyltransferase A (GT-A) superfamily protein (DUF2064 family)